MRRYALILTALVLSLSLVADAAFAQRGGRGGGGGGGRAGGGAGSSVNRSPSMSRPSTPSASRPSAPSTPFDTADFRPHVPRHRAALGRAAVNTSLDTEPSFGRATVNTSVDSKSSFGRAASGHTSRGRSRHASLNSERRHASQHRSRQDPERNRCPPRTAALDAGLVQARCLPVTQYASRATDRQSTSCSTWRW